MGINVDWLPKGFPNRPLRICFVGLGLGSVILDMVARELYGYQKRGDIGEVRFKLVDGDRFTKQKGDHESFPATGPKAKVKAVQIRAMTDMFGVRSYVGELWPKNAKRLLAGQDIIFCFTDVNNMKFYLSRYLSQIDTGVLFTGGITVDNEGGFGRVYLRRNGEDVTPPIEHGFTEDSASAILNRENPGFIEGRDQSNEDDSNRNRMMCAAADEIAQLFADLLGGEIHHDSFDLHLGTQGMERSYYFREEVFEHAQRNDGEAGDPAAAGTG